MQVYDQKKVREEHLRQSRHQLQATTEAADVHRTTTLLPCNIKNRKYIATGQTIQFTKRQAGELQPLNADLLPSTLHSVASPPESILEVLLKTDYPR